MRNSFFRQLPIALAAIGSLPMAAAAQIRTPTRDITLTTTVGPAPTGVTATPMSPTSINVSWNAGANVRGYIVDRRQTSDPACCTAQSAILTTTSWADNGLKAGTQYTFRVGVMYLDGSTGSAEVSAATPVNTVVGPIPATYGGTSIQNVVVLSWSPVPGAEGYNFIRNGAQIGQGGSCSPTCSINDTGVYGATYGYAIQTRFPAGSGMSQSQTPVFNVTIPHIITAPSAAQQIARASRLDVQITNTANPDGTRGGIVSGSGNGLTINDPGLNKLAMMSTASAPLGPQRVQLNAQNTAPAFLDVMVIRTPGQGALSLQGVSGFTVPGTSSTLRVEQASGQRWNAIFNSLAPIEFERDGSFGGASFCTNSDALGIVLTSNGRRAGVQTPWAWILQDLKNPSAKPYVIETQRYTSDGKLGLVPLIYTTPDCSIAALIDVVDNPTTPYRIRLYDLLIRSIFGAGYFNVAQMDYNQFQMNLYQGDAAAMNLVIKYPGTAGTTASQTYPMQNKSY